MEISLHGAWSCRLRFCAEMLEMCGRGCGFLRVLLLSLILLLFCAEMAKSEGFSLVGDEFVPTERYISGRQNAIDMTSIPWMRGLKQILPAALAAVPAYAESSSINSNYSIILAENRTRRPDILSKFRLYGGGWNITNKHYWASVSFTGAPGFILAILWFTAFGPAFFVLYFYSQIIKRENQELHLSYWVLLLLILFTFTAVVGCILLSMGQDKFHYEISQTLDFVVKQSDYVVENLRNVTVYLTEAENISIAQIVIPESEQNQIGQLNEDLDIAADELEVKTTDNAEKIQKALDALRDALIAVAGVMLLVAILGFLLTILGFTHIICGLVIIGWFLVTGTFVLSGVFIALNNALADTCVAMEEWVDHPNANTNLDHILPCVNQSMANQTLYRSKEVTSDLVNVINRVIWNVANIDVSPSAGPIYYNQSGPQMPALCNPYDNEMKDQQCSPQQVNFTNADQVWQNYTCNVSNDICVSPGRVTPEVYDQLVAAVNLGYGLKHYTPFLVDLIDCKFQVHHKDVHFKPANGKKKGMDNPPIEMGSVEKLGI
ncbi:hypothetical protein SUGI_0091140 [Cryptomeria japonica]|nr:hypothetical protein SUGI_0091140 [Cryptomeria japonica]